MNGSVWVGRVQPILRHARTTSSRDWKWPTHLERAWWSSSGDCPTDFAIVVVLMIYRQRDMTVDPDGGSTLPRALHISLLISMDM